MSQSMLDKESWKRSLYPTIRVVGYFASIFVVYVIVYAIFGLLEAWFGFPSIVTLFLVTIGPFILVFAFVWSIFKVLDEEIRH